jgi:hypothetical protein
MKSGAARKAKGFRQGTALDVPKAQKEERGFSR